MSLVSLRSPRLPAEILHNIVTSYLSPAADTHTLHTLSLTHSFLLNSTRIALFDTIQLSRHTLDDGVHPHLCSSLADLLRVSPHISGYIRKLVIVEGTICNSWFGHTRYWVTSEDEDLPFILRMVAFGGQPQNDNWRGIGLRSLEIFGCGRSMIMDWSNLHANLREAFVDVFDKGKLEDLRLIGLDNFPLHVLRRTRSLKNICFGGMDSAISNVMLETASYDDDHTRRPQLNFLNLSFEHNVVQGLTLINVLTHPTCPLDTSHLEHIVVNDSQHPNLQKLFDHCQSNLKFLEIRTNEYPIPTPPSHISLTNLSSLHCLSLFVPVNDWDEVNPKPFPWLDHLLSTLCLPYTGDVNHPNTSTKLHRISNPNLHTLQLIFDIDRIPLFERINRTEWSKLNSQLLRLLHSRFASKYAVVPDLKIKIYIYNDPISCDACCSPSPPLGDAHMMNCHSFIKDPLVSYSPISCSCLPHSQPACIDTRNSTSEGRGDVEGQRGDLESSQIRKFLTRFLPVLGTDEGAAGIKIYRTDEIPATV